MGTYSDVQALRAHRLHAGDKYGPNRAATWRTHTNGGYPVRTVTETLQRRPISDLAPLTPANLLDDEGRVAADVRCACGYNLRTLPAGGLCPECAAPVAKSLERYDEPTWLSPVRWALVALRGIVGLQVGGSVLFLVGVGISLVNEIDAASVRHRAAGPMVGELVCIVAPVPLVAAVLATMFSPILIWTVTEDLPSARLRGACLRARIVARVLLVVFLLSAIPSAVFGCNGAWDPGVAAACLTLVGVGFFFPAALARHVAEIVRSFGAVRPARSINRISLAIAFLYPAAWILFVLSLV